MIVEYDMCGLCSKPHDIYPIDENGFHTVCGIIRSTRMKDVLCERCGNESFIHPGLDCTGCTDGRYMDYPGPSYLQQYFKMFAY